MTAFIWSKNAHNLFDFESNQYTRKEIEIDFSGSVYILIKPFLARMATLESELLALTKNVSLFFIGRNTQETKSRSPISYLRTNRLPN